MEINIQHTQSVDSEFKRCQSAVVAERLTKLLPCLAGYIVVLQAN
jgi:hypothetical protein